MQALEKLHLKLTGISSTDFEEEILDNETSIELNEESESVSNDDFEETEKDLADNSLNTPQNKTKANEYVVKLETIDDDIEVLEIMKETIHEEMNNESDERQGYSYKMKDKLRKRVRQRWKRRKEGFSIFGK